METASDKRKDGVQQRPGGPIIRFVRPKVLIVGTYYPEFLAEWYGGDSQLADWPYEQQLRRLFATGFGLGDAYSDGLRQHGWEAHEVVCNADPLQARWALEHDLTLTGNVHDRRRAAVAGQVAHLRPDVLLVFEWCPLGDAFLAEIKSRVRLLTGQISSPLPANRTFAAYDLMISSWRPIVEYFRREGIDSEPLRLAFDQRVLQELAAGSEKYDVSFVGGFAAVHQDRIAWLERLLANVEIAVFAYGIEATAAGSRIRARHHGSVWGRQMYDVLGQSRITLNRHARIDVRGTIDTDVAANMRLYEATGVGTCLVTDAKRNLSEMFEPGREVVTYADDEECIAQIQYLLDHDEERRRIAKAGQNRTLREHTYAARMGELSELLKARL